MGNRDEALRGYLTKCAGWCGRGRVLGHLTQARKCKRGWGGRSCGYLTK